MTFNFFKSKPKENLETSKPITVNQPTRELENKPFFQEYQQEKKKLLPVDSMTREEILKEIEKQYITSKANNDNPFKTKEDVYYCFYNSNMELARPPVPFELIKVAGKDFYINKSFHNGEIKIEEMYAKPDVEIDLKSEYDKKETTKAQLEKINKYILTIKNEISKGKEEYTKLDINDLIEEKHRLEKILSSIKYGKSAIFKIQNPFNMKPSYFMSYCNGEYKYLKKTELNYITEENSVRAIKGQTIITKVQEIINLRIAKNWKEIIISIIVFLCLLAFCFGLWKMATYEETLFDKRVHDYCDGQIAIYKQAAFDMKTLNCASLPPPVLNSFNISK